MNKNNWIHFLGSYPPRECGIATFTQDLLKHTEKQINSNAKCKVVAMNENLFSTYCYPREVNIQIDEGEINSYLEAAEKLNRNEQTGVVCVQHEFGIFGGDYGNYVIPFLEELQKPCVLTFHSVLPGNPKPARGRRYVVRKIAKNVEKVVVISGFGKDILTQRYGIKEDKIAIIPHGVPAIPIGDGHRAKQELGLQERRVISTFGLMSKRKGIHYVIKAMPKIIQENPDALYLVIGETHPVIRKLEGERYRNKLKGLVKELGLKEHVMFCNKYLPLQDVCKYLEATDIYITPYCDMQQISSGTLAYAVGAGKACISTPYLYARDALRDDRGRFIKFGDKKSIARVVNKLLSDEKLMRRISRNAYSYSRSWLWPSIAGSYLELFRELSGVEY